MILPDLWLPSRAGLTLTYCGMDSPDKCINPVWFKRYPHSIQYHYNSRGFRDQEWPQDLSQVLWCVGDSFTVGLGQPIEHVWPYLLAQRTGQRTVNVSMDGASNDWICRVAKSILTEFPQARIVVHWSYIHRRELSYYAALCLKFDKMYQAVKDPSWPQCDWDQYHSLPKAIQQELTDCHGWRPRVYDDDRVVHYVRSTVSEDCAHIAHCVAQLPPQVTHTSIAHWTPPNTVLSLSQPVIATPQLDYARDGHHYGSATSDWLVNQIMQAWAVRAIG